MAPDTSNNELLSVSVGTGTTITAGDLLWYDNSDSLGGNNMSPVTVANPTATTITFANSY